MMRLLRLRRLVQVAALALLAATPWLNRGGFTGMKGSLFAFDFFGWPFADPLGPVQMLLSGMAPGWRLAAGGGAALLLALCLGRVFCSWLCPFGLLSEAAQGLRSKAAPPKPAKHSFRSRAAVMLAGLTLAALLGFPLLNQLSLPGGFSLGLITAAAPLSDKAILSLETRILFFALPFLPVLLVLAAEIVVLLVILLVIWVIADGLRYSRYRRRWGPTVVGVPRPIYYPVFWGRPGCRSRRACNARSPAAPAKTARTPAAQPARWGSIPAIRVRPRRWSAPTAGLACWPVPMSMPDRPPLCPSPAVRLKRRHTKGKVTPTLRSLWTVMPFA